MDNKIIGIWILAVVVGIIFGVIVMKGVTKDWSQTPSLSEELY